MNSIKDADVKKKFCRGDSRIALRLFSILLLVFIFFQNALANAATHDSSNLYQVEMIIFSKITDNALLSEQWQIPPIVPDTSKSIELAPSDVSSENSLATTTTLPAANQILPQKNWQLISAANQLAQHGYVILLHTAWLESFASHVSPPFIHLYGGQVWDSDGNALNISPPPAFPISNPNSFNWEMNGTIRITLDRYFNVHLNLLFAEPTNGWSHLISDNHPFKNMANNFAYFDLNQTRRMKSNELNYIEHPLYGVLIQIVPFTALQKSS